MNGAWDPKNTQGENDDSLLQLALSIAPRLDDPSDYYENDETSTDKNSNIQKIGGKDQTTSYNKVTDVLSHQSPPDPSAITTSVDAEIASQMAKLSVVDREQVYMDVHGVCGDYVKEETPELIHLSMLDLQNEIELLEDKRAYEIAERLNREYVHNQDFRLMFLRYEMFDCAKAVENHSPFSHEIGLVWDG